MSGPLRNELGLNLQDWFPGLVRDHPPDDALLADPPHFESSFAADGKLHRDGFTQQPADRLNRAFIEARAIIY
jgi:hypothetical protein